VLFFNIFRRSLTGNSSASVDHDDVLAVPASRWPLSLAGDDGLGEKLTPFVTCGRLSGAEGVG
jgi:hypothetical protein